MPDEKKIAALGCYALVCIIVFLLFWYSIS